MQVLGRSVVVVIALLTLIGCGRDNDLAAPARPATVGPLQPSEPFGLTAVTLRSPQGDTALSVPAYDAYTPRARALGLMGRKRLPRSAGMVFRFADDRTGGFWMKNTLIPLSIAYFDAAGEVVRIQDMEPCTHDPCPSYRPGARYRGALEVNQGYFAEVGVAAGWRVDVPAGLPPPE